MKRLIRKSDTLILPNVGDFVEISDDSKYRKLRMHELSMPENRDGAVIVDIKDNKVYWGFNGETHADLISEYYGIDAYDDSGYSTLQPFVAYGIYLKDFLGSETVIFYNNDIDGATELLLQNKPGITVYMDDYNRNDNEVQRVAEKRLIRKSENLTLPNVGEIALVGDDPKYQGLNILELSASRNRDGAVVINTKDSSMHIGLNGEEHADLLQQHYGVGKYNEKDQMQADQYLAYGVYLKNFLGAETIIIYSHCKNISEAVNIVTQNKPGSIVYVDNLYGKQDELERLANKKE